MRLLASLRGIARRIIDVDRTLRIEELYARAYLADVEGGADGDDLQSVDELEERPLRAVRDLVVRHAITEQQATHTARV